MKTKKYRLPKEFAEKWIQALRSGNYKRGRGRLYNESKNNYCCLGVACSILGVEDNLLNEYSATSDICIRDLELEKVFPEELTDSNLMGELIVLNDLEMYSFDKISDWIEKNVEFYD